MSKFLDFEGLKTVIGLLSSSVKPLVVTVTMTDNSSGSADHTSQEVYEALHNEHREVLYAVALSNTISLCGKCIYCELAGSSYRAQGFVLNGTGYQVVYNNSSMLFTHIGTEVSLQRVYLTDSSLDEFTYSEGTLTLTAIKEDQTKSVSVEIPEASTGSKGLMTPSHVYLLDTAAVSSTHFMASSHRNQRTQDSGGIYEITLVKTDSMTESSMKRLVYPSVDSKYIRFYKIERSDKSISTGSAGEIGYLSFSDVTNEEPTWDDIWEDVNNGMVVHLVYEII